MTWQIWHNWNILVFLFMKIAPISELINREHINNTSKDLAVRLPYSHLCLISLPRVLLRVFSHCSVLPYLTKPWTQFFVLFLFSDSKPFTNIVSQICHIFYKLYWFISKWKQFCSRHICLYVTDYFFLDWWQDLSSNGFILYINSVRWYLFFFS